MEIIITNVQVFAVRRPWEGRALLFSLGWVKCAFSHRLLLPTAYLL